MRLHHIFGASIIVALCVIVCIGSPVYAGSGTEGDPYTVCVEGCDYTTIDGAVDSASSGDFIEVQNSYDPTSETYPLTFSTNNVTITCESTSAAIYASTDDEKLNMSSGSTISGCTIGNTTNTNLRIDGGGGVGQTNVTITNNIFLDAGIIAGNNNLISGNTFTAANDNAVQPIYIQGDSVTVTQNTITMTFTGGTGSVGAILGGGSENTDITITTNTIDMASTVSNGKAIGFYYLGANGVIRGNKIKWAGSSGNHVAIFLYSRGVSEDVNTIFTHNTLYVANYTGAGGLLLIEDDTTNDVYQNDAEITYNIFYWNGTGNNSGQKPVSYSMDVSGSSVTEDYNIFAGPFVTNIQANGDANVTVTSGGHSVDTNANPLKHENASTSDDFDPAPYSAALDINGTIDAGAVSGVRGSSFNLDDNCTVDYTACHGTDSTLIENARSGDTWTLAAGTYDTFTLAGSNVTVTGAGATTIIDGANGNTSVVVTGSNSTVSNMTIQDVDGDPLYKATHMIFTYGGTDYDDDAGGGPNTTIILSSSECDTADITADDTDVTAYVSAGNDWHLLLVDFGGPKLTLLIPNQFASTPSEVQTACGGGTIDAWVTSTFALSGTTFTYDAAAVAAAGITLTSGYTNPPAITTLQPAGISVSGSTNTFESLTLDTNDWGVYFSGSSANNVVTGVTFTNTTYIDLVSNSTGDNYYNTLTGFDSNPTELSSGQLISGSPGAGGGDAIPEMSTYLLMLTLFAGFYYVYKKSDAPLGGAIA